MLDVQKIRADFPILSSKIYGYPLVYFDNAATTQKPQCVLDRIVDFYRNTNSNVHRGVHHLSELASADYENARFAVKDFINAVSVNEIIFCKGATDAINMLADSFGKAFVKEGDEIIISEMEHHSNIVPWQKLSSNKGVKLKVIPFDDTGRLLIEKLPDMINERTKLISVCHICNSMGVINPIKDIIKIAHEAGVPVMIDGAQSVPHVQIDVQDIDCDFLAFSGHKMYAETGIGVLYGKEKYLEKMPPYQTGGGMIEKVDFNKTVYSGLPHKFEAGTANYVSAISLATAIRYIRDISIEKIREYEQALLYYAKYKLKKEENLIIYGNTAQQCGPVLFNCKKIHALDASMILDKMGIAVRAGSHCAHPTMKHFGIESAIRMSVAFYNTFEEIDLLIDGIHKVKNMLP